MTATAAVLCALFVAAPVPKERTEAEKVVGTWKLIRHSGIPGGLPDLTIELTQGGKMTIRNTAGKGPAIVYEGEYKVVKDQLSYSVMSPDHGDKKETLTIKKLTETELQVVDPDGVREDFERVKPKEMEEKEKQDKK